jgi:rhamnulokinase
MADKRVVAIDLGAESGRVVAARFDGHALALDVIHRFPNVPVRAGTTLYWDALRLFHDMTEGIAAAKRSGAVESIGIDTWGVDWALLDRSGELIGSPVHYRDSRTDGMMDWVFERVSKRTLFERTGIQFMQINGLYSLASLVKKRSPQLEIAAHFLTIADLFNYWLTGAKSCEFTHVTTQQMFNPRTGSWDWETLNAVGIPTDIFGEIVQPGTHLGEYDGIKVIAPAVHDTGSAVVAVPTTTRDYCYISSGTWSLIGLEILQPIINDAAFHANLTNEGGVEGTYRLLKNVMGLWLIQQSRAVWRASGQDYTYEALIDLAAAAEPFRSLFDPDDPVFLPPGDIPARIQRLCADSGQPIPETHGQILRAIMESLALKYRFVLDNLVTIGGQRVERIHIIGGGTQNTLLCQMTANACQRPVYAGPVEATALGNAIVQLIALGELGSVADARAMLARSLDLAIYEPVNVTDWDEAYRRFRGLVTTV